MPSSMWWCKSSVFQARDDARTRAEGTRAFFRRYRKSKESAGWLAGCENLITATDKKTSRSLFSGAEFSSRGFSRKDLRRVQCS